MTVHLGSGKAPWPLSAALGLVAGVLIAALGWGAFAIQKGSDAEHKLLAQKQQILAAQLEHDEELISRNTFNNSTLMTDMSVLKESMRNIETAVIDIQRRLK